MMSERNQASSLRFRKSLSFSDHVDPASDSACHSIRIARHRGLGRALIHRAARPSIWADRGQPPTVLAQAAGRSQASSSVSAGGAMEPANVAVMSAAVQQKLNRTQFKN